MNDETLYDEFDCLTYINNNVNKQSIKEALVLMKQKNVKIPKVQRLLLQSPIHDNIVYLQNNKELYQAAYSYILKQL